MHLCLHYRTPTHTLCRYFIPLVQWFTGSLKGMFFLFPPFHHSGNFSVSLLRAGISSCCNSNKMRYKFCLKAYMGSHKHPQTGLGFVLEPACNKNMISEFSSVLWCCKEDLKRNTSCHWQANAPPFLIQHISTPASISLQQQKIRNQAFLELSGV